MQSFSRHRPEQLKQKNDLAAAEFGGLLAGARAQTEWGWGMSLNPIERNRIREHVKKRLNALRQALASADARGARQLKRHDQNDPAGRVFDLKLPPG